MEITQTGNVFAVNGNNVVYGVEDEELFNARNELDGHNVIEVKLPLEAGTRHIVQTNPALSIYEGDEDITYYSGTNTWVKDKTYELEEDDELCFILEVGEGVATIQIDDTTYTFNYNI